MADNYFDIPGTEDLRPEERRRFSASANEQDFVAGLEAMWRQQLEARKGYEMAVLQSLLFWGGDQWQLIESDLIRRYNRRIIRPRYCSEGVIDNQIVVYTRQALSMLTDNMPDFEAVASTSDGDDRQAAALGTRILAWRENADDEARLRLAELCWLLSAGEVLRKTYYDPDKQTPGEPEGDIETCVVDFFRYTKSPSAGWNWPPPALIEFDAHHVDWVKEEFDVRVEPEEVDDALGSVRELAMNVMTGKMMSGGLMEPSGQVIVKRLYAAPSKKYPNGKCWVWADGRLLKEHEFQAGLYPFSRAVWLPVPLRLYPMSFIEPLMVDQKALNTLQSQLAELRKRQLRGDVMTDGTGDALEVFSDSETGRKVLRMPVGAQKWDFVKYDYDVQLVQSEWERIAKNLHDKSGHPEPVLGQMTKGTVTATEMQLVREGSFEKIQFHANRFEEHLIDVCKAKLALVKEFYTAPRVIRDVGSPAEGEMTSFFGAELRSTRDVRAISIPRLTPAMRRQLAAESAQDGSLAGPWLGPDGTPNMFLEYAARTRLRARGLTDEEERIGRGGISYEELEKMVFELYKRGYRLQILRQLVMETAAQQQVTQMFAAQMGQPLGLQPGPMPEENPAQTPAMPGPPTGVVVG